MFTFFAAVVFLIITPGPGVLTTAGVGSGFGFRPGLRYVTGLFIGNNLVGLAVITGLAAVVLSVPAIRIVLTVASVAYLCYLAAKIAFAGSKIAFVEAKTAPGMLNGVLLQTINPKAYAVNTALYAGFPFLPDNLVLETVAKVLILNAVWIPVHLGWLWAGATLHRLNLPESAHRKINYAMAASLLAVVALALYASFLK
ncbi:LysE family translocator [Vannielia litorea]|uniref:Threonine/homoserine/homoserine lactone efflux protein n=1 Tax=Vannielia litorea TaxID=1217970 RepID=A0A1N6IHU2_9RHOB|nr:LysE family transporter [Vannielia litorea]SIO31597.1 Threonine/homoserine/homoserine lactone efflux protein [Vannielia litorea]